MAVKVYCPRISEVHKVLTMQLVPGSACIPTRSVIKRKDIMISLELNPYWYHMITIQVALYTFLCHSWVIFLQNYRAIEWINQPMVKSYKVNCTTFSKILLKKHINSFSPITGFIVWQKHFLHFSCFSEYLNLQTVFCSWE